MTAPDKNEVAKPLHERIAEAIADDQFCACFPSKTEALLREAATELSRMRTALEDAEKDAARYRFLRRFDHFATVDAMLDTMDYHTLDAAVDAAVQRAAIAERALAPEGRALTAGSGNE